MKKLFALLLALVMVLSLTACGGGRTEAAAPAEKPAEAAGEAAAPVAGGIEAGATIGVSLPWLGTQNWKEAEEMFKTELEAAGFKPLIQAADNKVPQQQQQIESMIQNGAKVIVVGPIDGTQLGAVLEEAKA
ncbi:MAG: substrate-binding domain-containing protein, partial [Oscillospiraceae bacterium]|nr:substrate-binding domain-containing protein [Oscillospiraceae bacterium]